MALVRYLLTVLSLAVVLVGFLLAWAQETGPSIVERPQILALAVPESVVAGERVSLFGGIRVPAGSFELGTYACQSGSCSRSHWRGVEGPGDVWGGFGAVQLDGVGESATVEVRLFEADGRFDRIVASWRRSVDVVAAESEGEQPGGRFDARSRR